jgi:hypothetical protein
MNNKPLINLFEENELNIATLYSLYAQKIPAKVDFWERLSNEEISHAAQVGTEKNNTDAILENNFSRGVIKHIMDFVLEQTQKAQQENLSHADAILTALRIERSMLEKKYFDFFTPSNKTVHQIFSRLNKETEKHIQILLKEAKKNKIAIK